MDEPEGYSVTLDTGTISVQGQDISFVVHRILPDDNPAYALIGRVAAEWARLEHILDTIIWELAGLDQVTGSCLTAPQFTYRARVNMILALVAKNQMSEAAVKQAKSVKKVVGEKAHIRNNYIHNAWFLEEKDGNAAEIGQVESFSFGDPSFGFKAVDLGQFQKDIDEIKEVTAKAGTLRAALSAEWQTLQRKRS